MRDMNKIINYRSSHSENLYVSILLKFMLLNIVGENQDIKKSMVVNIELHNLKAEKV